VLVQELVKLLVTAPLFFLRKTGAKFIVGRPISNTGDLEIISDWKDTVKRWTNVEFRKQLDNARFIISQHLIVGLKLPSLQ
jgi:hypothetical protein